MRDFYYIIKLIFTYFCTYHTVSLEVRSRRAQGLLALGAVYVECGKKEQEGLEAALEAWGGMVETFLNNMTGGGGGAKADSFEGSKNGNEKEGVWGEDDCKAGDGDEKPTSSSSSVTLTFDEPSVLALLADIGMLQVREIKDLIIKLGGKLQEAGLEKKDLVNYLRRLLLLRLETSTLRDFLHRYLGEEEKEEVFEDRDFIINIILSRSD